MAMADTLVDPLRSGALREVTERLSVLTQQRPAPSAARAVHAASTANMSLRPLAWQHGASSGTRWHRRVGTGEQCGACGLPDALYGHLTRPGARYRRMDHEAHLRCAIDGGEGYLAMERSLTCVHDRDNTSAACLGIRLPKCRATPGCHTWADLVDRMRPQGLGAWMDAVYGSPSASPFRFRWQETMASPGVSG